MKKIYLLVLVITVFSPWAQALELDPTERADISTSILSDCEQINRQEITTLDSIMSERGETCTEDLSDAQKYQKKLTSEKKYSQSFLREITQGDLSLALTSYILFSQRFLSNNSKGNKENTLTQICTNGASSNCLENEREFVNKEIISLNTTLQNDSIETQNITIEMAHQQINGHLALLDILLNEIEGTGIEVSSRWLGKSQPKLSQKAYDLVQAYTKACIDIYNLPVGVLLTQGPLKGTGQCRQAIRNSNYGLKLKKNNGREFFSFVRHGRVSLQQVEKAIQQQEKMFLGNINQKIINYRMFHSPKLSEQSGVFYNKENNTAFYAEKVKMDIITEAITTDSPYLAEALMKDPFQAVMVCRAGAWAEMKMESGKQIKAFGEGMLYASIVTGVGSLVAFSAGLATRGIANSLALRGLTQTITGEISRQALSGLGRSLIKLSAPALFTASTFSIAEFPALAFIELKERRSLADLQKLVFKKALHGELTINDNSQQIEQTKTLKSNRSKLIWSAFLLPLDGFVFVEGIIAARSLMNTATTAPDPNKYNTLVQEFASTPSSQQSAFFKSKQSRSKSTTHSPQSAVKTTTLVNANIDASLAVSMNIAKSIKSFGLSSIKQKQFLKALNLKNLKNHNFVNTILKNISPERFNQSSDSAMVIGFAVRVMSKLQNGAQQAIHSSKIINSWSDYLISAVSVVLHKAIKLMAYIPGLPKIQAVEKILVKQGADASTANNLRKCIAM